MSPFLFLVLVVALSAGAWAAQWLRQRRRRSALENLARQWSMHYSPEDRFRLTERVAEGFPVPGAAHVRVGDVIYSVEGERYRYIFAAEYTIGVLRRQQRRRQIAMVVESRQQGMAGRLIVEAAPQDLPWLEQYRHLYGREPQPPITQVRPASQ